MGGVRTALFNYLFAKKHGGDFLLRIEDTDQTRYVPGAEEYIAEALAWCGLSFDESPARPGACGPYRQSERKAIYAEYALQLVEAGHAYYAFDTPEELEAMRERQKAEESSVQQYNAVTRVSMRNSYTLGADETQKLIAAGEPYVIRFNMPANELLEMTDIVRGQLAVNTKELDDKVLYKSDGMPTYHLANVVDDHLMEVTHVIRGEEWLPSMPLHVLLYRSFGWADTMPEFAHLSLLLKPSGKGKLSKRDGDKLGFPVFPLEWRDPQTGELSKGYREDGYYPEAFINMLALLGWNPGTEQEIFSLQELIPAFELHKVSKSGARFDLEKAHWFNQQYLRQQTDAHLAEQFMPIVEAHGHKAETEFVTRIVTLTKERAVFVRDLWEHASFFFEAPTSYDAQVVKKRWKGDAPQFMAAIEQLLAAQHSFVAAELELLIKEHIQANSLNMGQVMNCIRLALVGESKGPHIFDILELLGQSESCRRIRTAVETLQV